MSIKNRKVTTGKQKVKKESKVPTLVGKMYCFVTRKHLVADVFGEDYCIICWKKMERKH